MFGWTFKYLRAIRIPKANIPVLRSNRPGWLRRDFGANEGCVAQNFLSIPVSAAQDSNVPEYRPCGVTAGKEHGNSSKSPDALEAPKKTGNCSETRVIQRQRRSQRSKPSPFRNLLVPVLIRFTSKVSCLITNTHLEW